MMIATDLEDSRSRVGRVGCPPTGPAPRRLTISEAADALGLNHRDVRGLIEDGHLLAAKTTGTCRIEPEALMRYVAAYGYRGPGD